MKNNEHNDTSEDMKHLASDIARLTKDGELYTTAVPGLSLYRREEPSEPFTGMYEPSICMVAQGAKHVKLGDDEFTYDPQHYLITSIHLPTTIEILDASPEKPYLGLRLIFDQHEISKLMADSNLAPPRTKQSSRGMATGRVKLPLLSAIRRLVSLLDSVDDIAILAPLIQREVIYRLLVGENSVRLRQIAAAGSQSREIAEALQWLGENYKEKLRVEDLADQAGMSKSTFHHHFRSMTALSPLQYQKQLRLQEARRLMLSEHMDAETAGFKVGYQSPSQFSREYSRLFGAPPLRDIKDLQLRIPSQ